MPPSRVCQCLGAVNMLSPEGCSQTGTFWHSSNHIFPSQLLVKYLSYEAGHFFSKWSKFYVNFENAKKHSENVFRFADNGL